MKKLPKTKKIQSKSFKTEFVVTKFKLFVKKPTLYNKLKTMHSTDLFITMVNCFVCYISV